MTKLTKPQRALLNRLAAEPGGVANTPGDAKLCRIPIRQSLAVALPHSDSEPGRLMITAAGRAALEPEEGSGQPSEATEPPVQDQEATCEEVAKALGRVAPEGSSEAEADTPMAPPVGAPRRRKASPDGKLGTLVALMTRPEGATVEQMSQETNWQLHSVRGAMAGTLKKRFGFTITSEKTDGVRVYRITTEA